MNGRVNNSIPENVSHFPTESEHKMWGGGNLDMNANMGDKMFLLSLMHYYIL